MRQKKSNTFNSLWYMGLAVIGVPVCMILLFVIMAVASNNTDAPFADSKTKDVKKEKVIEKVYIHDTVEIPCRRKHCDEHTVKKTEKTADSTPIIKPDTLK